MRQVFWVILAVGSMAALAQSPPASKPAKANEPVFLDPGKLTQTGPPDNKTTRLQDSKTAGQPGQTPGSNLQTSAISAATTNAAPTPATLTGYVPDDKYKLRMGDKISLQILEDREAPKPLMVMDSGELDVPYIGRVAASDKTCKELSDELKVRLEKEYYHRATVIIALDVANKLLGRIYVWGQVRNQGPIDITVNENLTAGKAILRAGGFGDFANKKKVKVVRGGNVEGAAKQSFELNMVDILENGKTEKDVVLQPDDFIIVPSRLINF